MENQLVKVTFLTKSGEISTYIEAPATEEVEEIAQGMANELAQRPKWMAVGNICFFSGAVSAISVDIYDREAA